MCLSTKTKEFIKNTVIFCLFLVLCVCVSCFFVVFFSFHSHGCKCKLLVQVKILVHISSQQISAQKKTSILKNVHNIFTALLYILPVNSNQQQKCPIYFSRAKENLKIYVVQTICVSHLFAFQLNGLVWNDSCCKINNTSNTIYHFAKKTKFWYHLLYYHGTC